MITVTFYYLPASEECERVRGLLDGLQSEAPHQLVAINIAADPNLNSLYAGRIPLVQVGPYTLEGTINRERLVVALGAARDRAKQLERIDQKAFQDKLNKGHTFTSSDRLSIWISNYYIHGFNLLLFLYFGLSFVAPVLMKVGAVIPASIIYRVYSPLCHQLAYRSWFLFGEQAFYPRALAAVPGVLTYEQVTNLDSTDVYAGRDFIGNATVGYKGALCQRDVAMYCSMWLFGVVFWIGKRRIRPLPWYLWVLIGLVPIGLDGFSQLPSVIAGLPAWLPIRESNPFLRTVTGSLFGIMTAWYLFPLIEESMRETRRMMTRKQAIASQASISGRD
jgi:uncharacterized membrane protein